MPGSAVRGSSYIEPGAPWENPFVESFNGRLRDEFLAVEQFDSLLEAQVLIEDWRIEYNTKRPQQQPGLARPRLPTPSAGRLSNTLDSHKRWVSQRGSGHTPHILTRKPPRVGVQVARKGWPY